MKPEEFGALIKGQKSMNDKELVDVYLASLVYPDEKEIQDDEGEGTLGYMNGVQENEMDNPLYSGAIDLEMTTTNYLEVESLTEIAREGLIGTRILDELGRYGKVVSPDILGENHIALRGASGELILNDYEMKHFSLDIVAEDDWYINQNLVEFSQVKEFFGNESMLDRFGCITEEFDARNLFVDVLQRMGKKKRKMYLNKFFNAINISCSCYIFDKLIEDIFVENIITLEELDVLVHLDKDFFWLNSNGIVQVGARLIVLKNPPYFTRAIRRAKKCNIMLFPYVKSFSCAQGTFKYNCPLDLSITQKGDSDIGELFTKEGVPYVRQLYTIMLDKSEISKIMKYFKRRRFLFLEYRNSAKNVSCFITRPGKLNAKGTFRSTSGGMVFTENEEYKDSTSNEERIEVVISVKYQHLRYETKLSVRVWFEFS
jgi:hypothetical protein